MHGLPASNHIAKRLGLLRFQ